MQLIPVILLICFKVIFRLFCLQKIYIYAEIIVEGLNPVLDFLMLSLIRVYWLKSKLRFEHARSNIFSVFIMTTLESLHFLFFYIFE